MKTTTNAFMNAAQFLRFAAAYLMTGALHQVASILLSSTGVKVVTRTGGDPGEPMLGSPGNGITLGSVAICGQYLIVCGNRGMFGTLLAGHVLTWLVGLVAKAGVNGAILRTPKNAVYFVIAPQGLAKPRQLADLPFNRYTAVPNGFVAIDARDQSGTPVVHFLSRRQLGQNPPRLGASNWNVVRITGQGLQQITDLPQVVYAADAVPCNAIVNGRPGIAVVDLSKIAESTTEIAATAMAETKETARLCGFEESDGNLHLVVETNKPTENFQPGLTRVDRLAAITAYGATIGQAFDAASAARQAKHAPGAHAPARTAQEPTRRDGARTGTPAAAPPIAS